MRARATAPERNRAGRLARRLTGPYTVAFVGGRVGAALRAWIGELLPGGAQAWACVIPWTILAVNFVGVFLLGLLAGLLAYRFPCADPRVRLFLGTGFLGSLTICGTSAVEAGVATTAQVTAYAVGSIACDLLCAWDGLPLGTRTGRGNVGQGSARWRDQLADESKSEASA